MKPIKLKINTKTEKYPIIIGSNLISKFSKIIKNNSINFKKSLIVIDKNVPKKFVIKLRNNIKKETHLFYFHANEKIKTKKQLIIFLRFY